GLRPRHELWSSEHGEVPVRRGQRQKVDLTITHGGQLTVEQRRWRTVLASGLVVVDDGDPSVRCEGGMQPVEEFVGMLDLVIDVRQDRELDGLRGKSRIGRRAVYERHADDPLTGQTGCQAIEVGLLDVLGVDGGSRSETLYQPHRIVAITGTEDGH